MASGAATDERQRASQLTRGRKFSSAELQLQLLWLLRDGTAHGYALARRFDELSLGYYSPSPGMLYPALGELEAQGLVRARPQGRRKDYALTAAGRRHLDQYAAQAQSLIDILRHAAKRMLWLNRAGDEEAAAATGWLPAFVQARKELRAALLERDDAGHAEQRRIIAILQRATREIRKTPPDSPVSPPAREPR